MKQYLSGNEAIALAALHAGVRVAAGYPGTPSTEILEVLAPLGKGEVYCEWSPNEKVAFEVAAGAALAGARALATMKHVGLNVAADPLMTLAYTGVPGGFVACVADDPGMHSSQNEQDTRHFARFAKVPVFEPADAQECYDFMRLAVEVSEQFQSPVILRPTTRVSHSRGIVEDRPAVQGKPTHFEKDRRRFVCIPGHARLNRLALEKRLAALDEWAVGAPVNRVEPAEGSLGIIAVGVAYNYVREVLPSAAVLKLGSSFPLPESLIRKFALAHPDLVVVEELEPIVEQQVKAWGISCRGKDLVPGIGELSPGVLVSVRDRLEGRKPERREPAPETVGLPPRPPVLCPGCPHRGLFHVLRDFDVIVAGDIGCYSLGTLPPLDRMDTLVCMGSGISMAHGMAKAGNDRKVVGVIGDSTFFHSGITGLIDIVYNRGTSVIIIMDNRTTAMTGHQNHPGTGRTLMGKPTPAVSIEAVVRACGVRNVHTVDPMDVSGNHNLLARALELDEPTVIIATAPCVLHERPEGTTPRTIDTEDCVACGSCLSLGCPALESHDGKPVVNAQMCLGCCLCEQVCDLNLIHGAAK